MGVTENSPNEGYKGKEREVVSFSFLTFINRHGLQRRWTNATTGCLCCQFRCFYQAELWRAFVRKIQQNGTTCRKWTEKSNIVMVLTRDTSTVRWGRYLPYLRRKGENHTYMVDGFQFPNKQPWHHPEWVCTSPTFENNAFSFLFPENTTFQAFYNGQNILKYNFFYVWFFMQNKYT